MIDFLDGPAAGVSLRLARVPVCLRAVCGPQGNWDALDLLTDEPRKRERVFVYVLVSDVARYHIRATNRAASGCYWGAKYMHYGDAPTFADNAAWQAWTQANKEAIDAFRVKHHRTYFSAPKGVQGGD